jgi:hypothetical protein
LAQHFAASGLRGAGTDGGFLQPFGRGHRNILGLLEGNDPQLKQEVIVIGAHYDHVGYGTRRNSYGPWGYIHNGADDNASGVAGVLETLEAYTSLLGPPRRSILFALWDGEEQGLLGSKHFLANPTVPKENLVFAVNVDMIGRLRNQRLVVFGTRTSYGLRRLLAENNRDVPLELDFDWEIKANSDHHPFFANQIPYIMLHTGMHDDCHRPSDDAHLINASGMEQVARLLFNVTHVLAERDELADFRTACWRETPAHRKHLDRPLAPRPPRLGVRWKGDATEDGLLLVSIERGSAAARSELQIGDRLIEFNGKPVHDTQQFIGDVLAAPTPVQVVVLRGEQHERVEMSLELNQAPTRVGISWREDDAEPETVLLTRIIPGSPADLAELRTGDRIYAVAGRTFAGTEQFIRLVTTLPGPLELTIERGGQVQTVSVPVPPPLQTAL